MNYERVVSAASHRCAARQEIRRARGKALALLLAGGDIDPRLVEPLGRQYERARLMNRGDLADRLGQDTGASRRLFEAIVGRDDTLPRRFLGLGELAARPVGRIVVHLAGGNGRYGTGALVGQHLVITNNHVLESAEIAAGAEIQMGYYEGADAVAADHRSFPLRPDDFFYTSEALDFTLVGLQAADGGAPTAGYGHLELLPATGKALIGERVNIVQHAGGQPQTISIRANMVVDVFDQWIHYTSDTAPGSSGSPIFNDSWQLVGLHHAAVPRESETGERFVVNEGIRASAIMQNLVETFGGQG